MSYMKLYAVAAFLLIVASHILHSEPLTRASEFESVAAFTESIAVFKPAEAKDNDFAYLFAAQDGPNQPKPRQWILAASVKACDVLSQADDKALVFALAEPPTEASKSCAGVLFLLIKRGSYWAIADYQEFKTFGKYASIEAQESGYIWHNEAKPVFNPFWTIKQSDGGRGVSYVTNTSYQIVDEKLVILGPR